MRKQLIQEEDSIFSIKEGLISTNQAVAHLNGSQTDETLLSMSNSELERMAYGDIENLDYIRMEKYKRTSDRRKAELQGGYPGEEYVGTSRAWLLLDSRINPKEGQKIKFENERVRTLANSKITF